MTLTEEKITECWSLKYIGNISLLQKVIFTSDRSARCLDGGDDFAGVSARQNLTNGTHLTCNVCQLNSISLLKEQKLTVI